MKILLWLILIILVVILGFESRSLKNGTTQHYSIMQLEFADAAQGKTMLQTWQQTPYAGKTLLDLVKSNTHTDFIFLIVYTILLIIHSNGQMQQERNLALNTLLRLNLFLAVIAGLSDAAENCIILYDIRHMTDVAAYLSSCWVSTLKWVLIAWILAIYLVSAIHAAIISKSKQGSMLKKILVSFAIGTALFLICLQLANSYFTVEAEEGLYKKVSWLRASVFGDQVNKTPILMINTGTDVQEFKHPPRSAVVADRSDLIKLFQLITQSGDKNTSVMLNLDLTDDRNFLPRVKDSLQSLISQLRFICIPEIKKGEEIKKPPFSKAQYGWADYETFGSHLDKMKLVDPDGVRLSLPMLLYRREQRTHDQVIAGWIFENGSPCFNYIWPVDYLKLERDFKRTDYEVWDLDAFLKNLARHPESLKSELQGRRIFIGDFREISATHSAAMPDIYILANTYLTLTAGQHRIGLLWILLTLVVFTVLAYYSYYESLPKITLPKWFPLSIVFNKYVQEWISYAIAMTLWSLITIFFFGISVNVLAATTVFSLINYLKFKKYAEE